MSKLIQAFRFAFRGLGILLKSQRNARIHVFMAALVVVVGAVLNIPLWAWSAVILSIGLVLTAECGNTALELLADALHPEQHPLIGRAKDVAAAGVLAAAVAAAAVGLLVFLQF